MLDMGAFFIAGHFLPKNVYREDQRVTDPCSTGSHIATAPWELLRGLTEHSDLEVLVPTPLRFSHVNVN